MSAEIRCPRPQCGSENIVFSKKRGRHVCEDCAHEFAVEKPFAAKRIFISYGYDQHVSLAHRLKSDLEARGHRTWNTDKDALPAGTDWERHLEAGLAWLGEDRQNAAVLLLLTPHSVRRPDGYCLNEVARAVGQGLRIIPLMVVESEPPLSICRIQWLDMRECIPIHEKEVLYRPRFERLLRALEANQLDFEGTQNRLLAALNPIQFSTEIVKLLQNFTGRRWVFAEVDAWLANPAGAKVFWITGAPGVGKSAISAWIRDHRREVAAFHFCDINSEEKRNPGKLVRSIVYQLSTQLPEYERRLAALPLEGIVQEYREAYTLFDKLLIQPLAETFPPPDRTIVVLIDALDEATYQRQNEIVRFLALCAEKTPCWLRFLVTSRPEPEIVSAFQRLSPYVLDTSRAENFSDLREYLSTQLPAVTPEQSQVILERSEGVFLYVRHVVEAVFGGHLSLQRLEEFPRGLSDVYQQFFQRQFGRDLAEYEREITPLLRIVLAAHEPLSLGLLKQLAGFTDDTTLFRVLNRLGSLFPASGQDDGATLRPFHRSIVDWIMDRGRAGVYIIAATDGVRALARHGWKQFQRMPETMDDYFLAWLPAHLRAIADEERFVRLLADFRYLMRRLKQGKLERVLEDYREMPAPLVSARGQLEIHAAFFREKAHILRRSNVEWPAHKILLQLAIEHADDSPLTLGAEQWLAEERCDWTWVRRNLRQSHGGRNPCLAVLEGHVFSVSGAIALHDGRILSWSEDSTLRLWDCFNGQPLALLEGHSGQVEGALIFPDGRILSWSKDATLRLWDGRSGKPLACLVGHSQPVIGALVHSDYRILSWSEDSTLRLWDGHSGQRLGLLKGHSGAIAGAQLLSDGRILSWSNDSTLRLWNGLSGEPLTVLSQHTASVNGAIPIFGGRILSWSDDNTLILWDGLVGNYLSVFVGHSGAVCGAVDLQDGRILSWSSDSTLRLWDVFTGQTLAVFVGHTQRVDGAAALPDGRILSWSRDNTLRIWDASSGTPLAVLEGHDDSVIGMLMLPDERILSWSADDTLRLWDGTTGNHLMVFKGHSRWVKGALLLPSGKVLSWSWDGTLRLWEVHAAEHLIALTGHSGLAFSAVALPDGRVLSWSADSSLRLWDSASGQPLGVLSGHSRSVTGALALPNGTILSWSTDAALRLWDGLSGQPLAVLHGHAGSVKGALILSNGNILSWSDDNSLRLWEVLSGRPLVVLDGHSDSIVGALALPDGRVLSWSRDKTLRLWEVGSGKPLVVLKGHSAWVLGALALADGRILSWSADENLRLWEGHTGRSLAILSGHTDWVDGALVLPDNTILSWSADGTIRLWESRGARCLEVASKDHVAKKHPEWLHARARAYNTGCVSLDFFAGSLVRTVTLHHKAFPDCIGSWNTESTARVACLLPNGTIVVSQVNGQVCFLQLHHGNRRITLTECEKMLAQQGIIR